MAEASVWHVIHKPTAKTLCGQPNDGTKPADGQPCNVCATAMYDAFGEALDELERLRAEVAELEKPHQCSYSGMTVKECVNEGDGICDCFGGSTWPQRAMAAENEAMRLIEQVRALVDGVPDHGILSPAAVRKVLDRG